MLLRKFSKLGSSNWLKMNFKQKNSLNSGILWHIFLSFLENSLTFRVLFQIPSLLQIFQVSRHPVYSLRGYFPEAGCLVKLRTAFCIFLWKNNIIRKEANQIGQAVVAFVEARTTLKAGWNIS